MEKEIKIKNISRGDFTVALDVVKAGRHFNLKSESFVKITEEELDYLTINCPRAFSEGYLKVCDETVAKEFNINETENEMSKEDIATLISKTKKPFETKIKKITSSNLLKDIRTACESEGKNSFVEIVDKRLNEVLDGSIVM